MNQFKPTDWKDKLDALKFVSETHRNVREERRKLESRVFFTTVAFFAIIVGAKFSGKISLSSQDEVYFIIGTFFMLLVSSILSALYIYRLSKQSKKNRKIAEKAEAEILNILDIDVIEIIREVEENKKWYEPRTCFWEVAIISLLAISIWISISLF